MKKIIFICHGNTCRSPMAEKIFNSLIKKYNLKNLKAFSFGLGAINGEEMNLKAKRALKKIGITVGAKKSQKLEKIESNALYITMTKQQKTLLNFKNVFSFGELIDEIDVDDPYGKNQEEYDQTAKQILYYCEKLVGKLKNITKS